MTLGSTERLREMRGESIVLESPSFFDTLIGFEDEEEQEETEEESEEESESEEEEDEEDKAATGLKKALQKERQQRRETAKQLKDLQRQIDSDKQAAGQKEEDSQRQAREKEEAATRTKLERLGVGYRNTAVDTALARALRDPKMPQFQDPDDVLQLVRREDIDVDQDDDDPTDVVVDEDDVRKAIKQLAKKKPHLLKPSDEGEGEGGSGEGQQGGQGSKGGSSKFNGRNGNSNQTADQRRQEMSKKYSALRHR